MHKLILFDWGNVLIDSESSEYNFLDGWKDVIRELKPKDSDLLLRMFNRDKMTIASGTKFSVELANCLLCAGCSCTVNEFKACYLRYARRVPWYTNMVNFVNDLVKDDRFHVGILSTLYEVDAELLKENLVLDKFDFRFFSFNLGVQKPDKRIYEIVETVSGYSGDEILFFDDREENIEAAKSMGWNAVLATGNDFKMIRSKCYEFMGISNDNQTPADDIRSMSDEQLAEILMDAELMQRVMGEYCKKLCPYHVDEYACRLDATNQSCKFTAKDMMLKWLQEG